MWTDLAIKALLVLLLFMLVNIAARTFGMAQMSFHVPLVTYLALVIIKFSGQK